MLKIMIPALAALLIAFVGLVGIAYFTLEPSQSQTPASAAED